MSKRPTCVVLGGSGFLGQALCSRLLKAGYAVRSISRSGHPRTATRSWHSEVEWIAASIDSDSAARALEGADIVYHLASSTLPSTSNLDMPFDLQANTLATLRLLNAARMRIGKLIFVSSGGGTVYGSPQCNPIPESCAINRIAHMIDTQLSAGGFGPGAKRLAYLGHRRYAGGVQFI